MLIAAVCNVNGPSTCACVCVCVEAGRRFETRETNALFIYSSIDTTDSQSNFILCVWFLLAAVAAAEIDGNVLPFYRNTKRLITLQMVCLKANNFSGPLAISGNIFCDVFWRFSLFFLPMIGDVREGRLPNGNSVSFP